MEEKKVQSTTYTKKEQSEKSSGRYGSSDQQNLEFISHGFPQQDGVTAPSQFDAQGKDDPTENLKELDAQLEKLQMEILMSSFDQNQHAAGDQSALILNTDTIGMSGDHEELKSREQAPYSSAISSAGATQGTVPQTSRGDDLNIKEFLFSFRNGAEKVDPQANTSRESSVGFLDQVAVQTQSDEEIKSFKSESEKPSHQSRGNYGEEL